MGKFIKKFKNKDKNSLIKRGQNAKKAFIFLALFLFMASPAKTIASTHLDTLEQETRSQLRQTRDIRAGIQNEVNNINTSIANIQAQINNTNSEINQSNAQIQKTAIEIRQTEENLKKRKADLSEVIKTSYIEGQASVIEVIVKSDSFSEFVNRAEYLEKMQAGIKEVSSELYLLKSQLEEKKATFEENKRILEQSKRNQILQQNALALKKNERNSALNVVRSEERGLQNTLDFIFQERARLARNNDEGADTTGGTGYPYANTVVYFRGVWRCVADRWNFCARQCTSYVSWRAASSGLVSSSDLRRWGSIFPTNGEHFAIRARNSGYSVSTTPKAGSIMVFPANSVPGGYGHVAFVESVNPNGTVNISEYNFLVEDGHNARTNVNPWFYNAEFINPR